jgi:hypothetical protein
MPSKRLRTLKERPKSIRSFTAAARKRQAMLVFLFLVIGPKKQQRMVSLGRTWPCIKNSCC